MPILALQRHLEVHRDHEVVLHDQNGHCSQSTIFSTRRLSRKSHIETPLPVRVYPFIGRRQIVETIGLLVEEKVSARTSLFIESLPPEEREYLERHLSPARLNQHDVVCEVGSRITAVYFPINAVISLVVPLRSGEIIEASMTGRDGILGASSALDSKVSLCRGIVQLGGDALHCDPDTLKKLAIEQPQLLGYINRHEQTLFAQSQQSAACNAAHSTESRLARWLLRAADLHGSHALDLTQEYIAQMLGVRRTSITIIARTLQHAGMIGYRRGHIELRDIEALQDTACECYQTVRNNYQSLLGRSTNSDDRGSLGNGR